MNSRFILPVIVSTALYALVFFAGNRSHPTKPPVVAPPTQSTPPDKRVVVVDIDPEPLAPDPDAVRVPKGEPAPSLPRGAEPLPKAAVYTEPIGPIAPPSSGQFPRIPSDRIGLPDGIDGGIDAPVITSAGLDNPPRARSQVSPAYPTEARSSGLTGEVLVEFLVDETGRVWNPQVVRSSDSRFDLATLRAVERWRFEPGKKDGRPVRFRMAVPVMFNLAM